MSVEVMSAPDVKPARTMSKKKYHEIVNRLNDECINKDDVNRFLNILKEVLSFDPDMPSYTKEIGQKIKANRNKLAQERGVTIYELSGSKACKERKRAALTC